MGICVPKALQFSYSRPENLEFIIHFKMTYLPLQTFYFQVYSEISLYCCGDENFCTFPGLS